MTGLVRKATLFSVCGLLAASAAMAGVPDPTKSVLGGTGDGLSIHLAPQNNAGVLNTRATKLITVRDAGNNPIANSTVVITFTTCTNNDIRLCSVQPNHPGALFNCAAKTATAVTNASGVATFLVAGGANNNGGNPPGVGSGCATVRADGVLLGSLTVATPDENNIGGVSGSDLSSFGGDRFGAYRGRSDFNADGAVTGADLSIFGQYRFPASVGQPGDASIASCSGGTVC